MAFDQKETQSDTHTRLFDDASTALTKLLGEPKGHRFTKPPALDITLEEIDRSGAFADLGGRDAYLAWVDDYKDTARRCELAIRALKTQRKNPDMHVRYRAQWRALDLASGVTKAIRLRRLGKRWSAARRGASNRP